MRMLMFSIAFSVISSEPLHKFTILVKSSEYSCASEEVDVVNGEGEEDDEDAEPAVDPDKGSSFTIQFEYTKEYPDEPPVMEVINHDNLLKADLDALQPVLDEQVSYLLFLFVNID